MNQTFMTVNVMRMAAFRGNAPVQALPQLSQYPGRAAGQRRQAVEQLMNLSRDCLRRLPLAVWRQRYRNAGRTLMTQCQQPVPGIGQCNGVASRVNVAVINICVGKGVGHDASVLKNRFIMRPI